MRTRRGFTLIEVLVVVTVIIALIGILLPALAVMRERNRQALTLRQLQELGNVIIERLNDGGDLPADFDARPAYYVIDVPASQGKAPQLELTRDQRQGDRIIDQYGLPVLITVDRATSLGRSYIAKVTIASQCRTQSPQTTTAAILADATANQDDLVLAFDSAKESRFVRVTR